MRAGWRGIEHRYQTWRLFRSKAGFVPPLNLMYDGPVGYRQFKENGDEFLGYYLDICDLKRNESVLDLGSGTGRKTLPLLSYLNDEGNYLGLEISDIGVDWCNEKYAAYPNFKFQKIDVYNQLYNPGGKEKAAEYKFPLPPEQFDFVVLNSVFTHMMPPEVENYLSEIARVLKKGGRTLISSFLLNNESRALIQSGSSSIDLKHEFGPARAKSRTEPELAIGYNEGFVMQLYGKLGLEIQQPIRYGSWCGREKFLSYQDLVVSIKTR
jgi:SAM-dependent methyltransferase